MLINNFFVVNFLQIAVGITYIFHCRSVKGKLILKEKPNLIKYTQICLSRRFKSLSFNMLYLNISTLWDILI